MIWATMMCFVFFVFLYLFSWTLHVWYGCNWMNNAFSISFHIKIGFLLENCSWLDVGWGKMTPLLDATAIYLQYMLQLLLLFVTVRCSIVFSAHCCLCCRFLFASVWVLTKHTNQRISVPFSEFYTCHSVVVCRRTYQTGER